MPRRPAQSEKPASPDDTVRCVLNMTRQQRADFRRWCEARGRFIEDVGTEWIMERLAQEEGQEPARRTGKK